MRDRLWFFVSGRNNAYNNYVANAFNPDGSRAVDDNTVKSFPGRITGQATRTTGSPCCSTGPTRFAVTVVCRDGFAGGLGCADAAGLSRRAGQVDTDPEQQAADRSGIHEHLHRVALQVPAGHPLATCRSAFAACPPAPTTATSPSRI